MDKKNVYVLSDLADRLAYNARNVSFLKEVEEDIDPGKIKEVHLYVVTGDRFTRGDYRSTKGVKELIIPKDCWSQIRDILLTHYESEASAAFNELKAK